MGLDLEQPGLPLEVLSSLVDLGTELQAEEVDLPRVLELATANAARLLGTEIAWLSLLDATTNHMRVAVSYGATGADFQRMEVSHDEGLGGEALKCGGPVIIDDYPAWAPGGEVRDAMLREGVVSVVCAPMRRGDQNVGVLYAGNRTPTEFTPRDASIVTALAAQASVAIANAQLYSSLLDKQRTLEATFEIHRALGAAAVSDLGVERVMRTLSDVTGRRLLLEQHIVQPFDFVSGPTDGLEECDEEVATVVSVRRSDHAVGRITVFGSEPLGELELNALSHGATVLALELMKHEAAQAVESRLRGELLEQLLEAGDDYSDTLVVRARRFGFDLSASCAILVIEARDLEPAAVRTLIQRALASRPAGARPSATLSGQRGERGVIALSGDLHDLERLTRALSDTLPEAVLWIGTSSGRSSAAASFREADACCQLARQASPGDSRVIHGSGLGPLRFMLDIRDLTNARAFVDEVLGPVAAHEQAGGAQLLATLRAYVEEDGHHQRIAERCHIHVSTVKYRLARIAELLRRPLQPWGTRFEITLAFRLGDLLGSVSDDPQSRRTVATLGRDSHRAARAAQRESLNRPDPSRSP